VPSATEIANFARCAHRIFLDANGPAAEAAPPTAEMERLWAEGREHEARIVATLAVETASGFTAQERRASTLALMTAGAPLIYHGCLSKDDLVGEPDLLRRIETPSSLGAHAYVPVDIKVGRATKSTASETAKTEYAMQLCAYAELLEHAQGVRPQVGYIIDRTGESVEVDLSAFAATYADIRARYSAVAAGEDATIPGWSTKVCPQCAWRDRCWRVLETTDDLTTMSAIGIPKREKLWAIGVRTVADLAAADPDTLATTKGLGKVARMWPVRARAVKERRPLLLRPWTPPAVDIEISYDVENLTDPFVYLHGLLVRPTGGRAFGDADFTEVDFGSFEPVCATHRDTEEAVWQRFLAKIEALTRHASFVVYIYSSHERTVLRRLRETFGGSEALTRFEDAMVDLCAIAKRSVVFPTDADGLKTIAKFVDFHWRDADPGGSQSITWWRSYLADPQANEALRDRVLAYNEDDVRATFAIRDWLARFSLDMSRATVAIDAGPIAEAPPPG
jgi:predicted RecB family nuclease